MSGQESEATLTRGRQTGTVGRVEGDNIALAVGQSITALRSNVNPLKLAHEAHDLVSILITSADALCVQHRKDALLRIDLHLHEIIADYERRGMEYDGPSS